MATVKKYQTGGPAPKKVAPKVIKKVAPKVKRDIDLSAPSKEMIKDLQKKGSMPPSQKNVGKKGIKISKAKGGKEMIKRADGSYSQRGLWDNIRANKGSGKKPTAAMLKQEKKIKAKSKK